MKKIAKNISGEKVCAAADSPLTCPRCRERCIRVLEIWMGETGKRFGWKAAIDQKRKSDYRDGMYDGVREAIGHLRGFNGETGLHWAKLRREVEGMKLPAPVELLTGKLIVEIYRQLVPKLREDVRLDYEGEIRRQGDTIEFRSVSPLVGYLRYPAVVEKGVDVDISDVSYPACCKNCAAREAARKIAERIIEAIPLSKRWRYFAGQIESLDENRCRFVYAHRRSR